MVVFVAFYNTFFCKVGLYEYRTHDFLVTASQLMINYVDKPYQNNYIESHLD